MLYKFLADAVVVSHFLWILFVIGGAAWGVHSRLVRVIHLASLGWALYIELSGSYCPLTHLEVWLRVRHDPATAYAGDFIPRYLERLVYLEAPRWLIGVLTVALVGINCWVYWRWWRKRQKGPTGPL